MTRRMIMHVPFPLEANASSASGIRPVQMRDAFRELGYEVFLVSGYSVQRASMIRALSREFADGAEFDFCYSESSTMPMTMTDPNHLPLRPLMDFSFLRGLRRRGVKVGHFLRDVYWAFPEYRQDTKFPKREAALAAYRWDVFNYRSAVDRLYLPSLGMGGHLGLPETMLAELPPGHGWTEPTTGPTKGLRLFYVGGTGAHYRLHRLLEALQVARRDGADASLTLCTPAAQWEASKAEYQDWLDDGVRVVQGHGPQLLEYLQASNVGALVVEPHEYRRFAAPVKLFDYLGAGKPVLASEGTYAAELVTRGGWGWGVPYDTRALADWLLRAATDPAMLATVQPAVATAREQHTWRARARQVATDLTP